MLTVYVLKTCDTCRKARKWLDEQGADYIPRDVRETPLSAEELAVLISKAGWEILINKSSTTWRGLTEKDKSDLDESKAVDLLLEHPTLMKRPVFVSGESAVVGFKAAQHADVEKLIV